MRLLAPAQATRIILAFGRKVAKAIRDRGEVTLTSTQALELLHAFETALNTTKKD